MCIFPFLRLKHLCLEPVCNKPRVHCRVKNRSMSTNTDRRITFPYNSFANILNIFKGKAKLLISSLNGSEAAVLGASALGWDA